jgi:hypothetical protein
MAAALVVLACGCDAGTERASGDLRADVLPATAPLSCERVHGPVPLPAELRETSGLARSARDPATVWSHNDAGHPPVLFAVNAAGSIVQRVHVADATSTDWEDIEAGSCAGEPCLYIGDIGDNEARRPYITVYLVREPAPGATAVHADAVHARYPDGPKDAESLFVLPDGVPHLITKGRNADIGVYRWPVPLRPGETVVLERVRTLLPRPRVPADFVTAASASPDGRWIGVRTYRTLYLFAAGDVVVADTVAPRAHVFDLTALQERQGEGLLLQDDGTVWLSSERARGSAAELRRLKCVLPA